MAQKTRKSKLFRILIFIVSILLVLFLLFAVGAGVVAAKYYAVMKADIPVEVTCSPMLEGDSTPTLGAPLDVCAKFLAPWNKLPVEFTATPGEGTQMLKEPSVELIGCGWGTCTWKLSLKVQPFRTEKTGEGSIHISFSGQGAEPETFDLAIPSFIVSPVQTSADGNLFIAKQIEEKEKSSLSALFVAGALILLVILCLLILLFRQKKEAAKAALLTPWESAIRAIELLKTGANEGKISPEHSIARLTDIVRNYLEKRFHLRAEHQTTDEFLTDLEYNESVLNEKHRHFLREFLSSADMVKFARLPADQSLFRNTAERAETLVTETIPEQKTGKEE